MGLSILTCFSLLLSVSSFPFSLNCPLAPRFRKQLKKKKTKNSVAVRVGTEQLDVKDAISLRLER